MLDNVSSLKELKMVEGYFTLRMDRKSNEHGEYPIYLNYSTMSVPVRKSTDIWVNPNYWLGNRTTNKYIQTGKNGHKKGDKLNRDLLNLKMKYDKEIETLLVDSNLKLTVDMLKSILNGTFQEKKEKDSGKVPFIQYVLDFNKNQYYMGKISYSLWKNIQCQMNRFKKYLQKELKIETNDFNILYCKDLKLEIIEGYIKWRKDEGNSNETINKSLTPIFKTLKKIGRKGWLDNNTIEEILDLYLPANIKSLGDKGDEKEYLTEEQVKHLIKITQECKYNRTKEFVDMFLFSVHTGGLRFSDVVSLKWSDIDMEKRLLTHHLQVKNHTRKSTYLTVPINEEGMKILKKWEGRFENFVFGLLPNDFDLSDKEKFNQIKNSKNKTMNHSLRCLGEKMKLPFNLHFHCSRHTFGTMSLNRGVDLNMISNLMGHSSSWVTGKVYSKYLPQTLSKEVNEKLNFKF